MSARDIPEAIVDLARLAGLYPVGVLCEILNSDGTMARLPQFEIIARKQGIRIVSIAGIIEYRKRQERLAESRPGIVAPVLMPAN